MQKLVEKAKVERKQLVSYIWIIACCQSGKLVQETQTVNPLTWSSRRSLKEQQNLSQNYSMRLSVHVSLRLNHNFNTSVYCMALDLFR